METFTKIEKIHSYLTSQVHTNKLNTAQLDTMNPIWLYLHAAVFFSYFIQIARTRLHNLILLCKSCLPSNKSEPKKLGRTDP